MAARSTASGRSPFGFVHNRLPTPFVVADQARLVGLDALIRRGATLARRRGFGPVAAFGAPSTETGSAAG